MCTRNAHFILLLDLAFAMDCTSSMSAYIQSAKGNICSIVDEIGKRELIMIRLALIEYRDHPPQVSLNIYVYINML
jgi:hypothetical protein